MAWEWIGDKNRHKRTESKIRVNALQVSTYFVFFTEFSIGLLYGLFPTRSKRCGAVRKVTIGTGSGRSGVSITVTVCRPSVPIPQFIRQSIFFPKTSLKKKNKHQIVACLHMCVRA